MNALDERSRWLSELAAKPSEKSWWTAFLLSLLLGFLGADRLYLGSFGLGLLKLLTFGGGGFWWAIDFILLCGNRMRDGDGEILRRPF